MSQLGHETGQLKWAGERQGASALRGRIVPLGDIPRRRKTGSADKPLRGQLRTLPLKTDHAPCVLVAVLGGSRPMTLDWTCGKGSGQ
jgi:hypothetical protein